MSALLVLVLVGLSCTALIAQRTEGNSEDTRKKIGLASIVENTGNDHIIKRNLFEASPSDRSTRLYNTVEAGRTKNGSLILIRAYHGYNLMPGKLDTGTGIAEIAYGTRSFPKQYYEVAHAEPGTVKWSPSSGGAITDKAIKGGYTDYGEILYICRFRHGNESNFICGHLHPSHRLCYIPFEGGVASNKDYEILEWTY